MPHPLLPVPNQGRPAWLLAKQAARLAGNGSGGTWRLPAEHQWAELLAVWDSTVAGGDVAVYRVEVDPDTTKSVRVLLQAFTFASSAVSGARAVYHVPPGAALAVEVSDYSGSGLIVAVLTTWPEA